MSGRLTPGKQLHALLFVELTPDVARGRHAVQFKITPHECGTPNVMSAGVGSAAFNGSVRGGADRMNAELQTNVGM
jgi:hypothetical protein